MTISFHLDGQHRTIDVPWDTPIATVLRDTLEQTATKVACSVGRCGACMVLIDGKPVNSCMVMAWQADGADIRTIDGLWQLPGAELVREALVAENAFQCGYCAPGFTITLWAFLRDHPDASEAEIRAALEGNLCRCTGYHSIIRGALRAADMLRGQKAGAAGEP
ncbi:(2Fe-2S)-binding protein [Rhizobium alvei]|uniref:(2Fe-2S)-binding protein n=1 Tax=Rhizobium alvei TaxID=1132659 RepID=A0ABT8YI61_9HYPH|nr:(2Fe-2S)-binding protein [Rhizobium alvei]MDO6963365.1 (2Fe-2S)-binding protein [Rhizobium alvei]